MSQILVADELIAKAQSATELEDFGGDSYREGLDILLGDYNANGASANERLQGSLMMSLCNRLKVTDT